MNATIELFATNETCMYSHPKHVSHGTHAISSLGGIILPDLDFHVQLKNTHTYMLLFPLRILLAKFQSVAVISPILSADNAK